MNASKLLRSMFGRLSICVWARQHVSVGVGVCGCRQNAYAFISPSYKLYPHKISLILDFKIHLKGFKATRSYTYVVPAFHYTCRKPEIFLTGKEKPL